MIERNKGLWQLPGLPAWRGPQSKRQGRMAPMQWRPWILSMSLLGSGPGILGPHQRNHAHAGYAAAASGSKTRAVMRDLRQLLEGLELQVSGMMMPPKGPRTQQ